MLAPTALLGSWTLTRVVDDRHAGQRRDVTGRTTLDLDSPDRVRWHEEGTMRWAGHAVPISRTLYVVRLAVPGAVRPPGVGWEVRFADGRTFHPWATGAEVEHPCAPDHYRGLIEVDDDPVTRWTVRWQARGPHKDYAMTTEHRRE